MYAREVDGKVLTFSVSGLLWVNSLVMLDQETGSEWSHILGEAKAGPLKGKQLEQVPSVMTDWASWKEQHPDGTVVTLGRTSLDYRRTAYYPLHQFVLGMVADGEAYAWTFDLLAGKGLLQQELAGEPVVVVFHRESMTPRLYGREVGGRVLDFTMQDGALLDRETGTRWHPVTGQAAEGPLKGKHLRPWPAIVSYRDVWMGFHQGGEVYTLK